MTTEATEKPAVPLKEQSVTATRLESGRVLDTEQEHRAHRAAVKGVETKRTKASAHPEK